MKKILSLFFISLSFSSFSQMIKPTSGIVQDLNHIKVVAQNSKLNNNLKKKIIEATIQDIDQKVDNLELNPVLQAQVNSNLALARSLNRSHDFKELSSKAGQAISVIKSAELGGR